jgi:LacI family transcriptional regulator
MARTPAPRPALPTRRPRIEDVAAAAGVSTATVSRVLNGQTVREPAGARVRAAVAQLGYVPHAGARALSLQRTGTVGAIVPTLDNAIFASAIGALQRRLAQERLQLLIATSEYDPTAEAAQARTLVERGVDAMVLCGHGQRAPLLELLRRRGLPCVHVMTLDGGAGSLCVGFDNRRAMARAAQHLLELGHRRIAVLSGITRDNDRARARVEGARDALQAAGLALPPERLVERRYALAEARDGLRQLLAARPAPTAVLCGNDVLAFGALLEAQQLGLTVPDQLSIVGFDDLELARHVEPALTTMRVPSEAMWTLAAERLIGALRQEPVPRQTELEVDLVVRQSTARVPRRRQGRG